MTSSGYITPRASWPRPATPTPMAPAWAGEFRDFDDWVNKATTRLTGTCEPLLGLEVPAICIDAIGRRCTAGGHFMRARDEGTFPIRFFWDCKPPEISLDGPHRPDANRQWLARQLLDSRLDDDEAYGVVAFHPLITDRWRDAAHLAPDSPPV